MAAVLAAGPGAVLSHRSAAELWRLMPLGDRLAEISVGHARRSRAGIVWHSSVLPDDEVTVEEAIPVTTVARTLLDLAAVLDRRGIERAIDEAEVRGYADAVPLPALLDRHPRRRGTAAVREILADGGLGMTVTRSELEERFLRFLGSAGLPRPELNVPIAVAGGFIEADCVWRARGLIVELDGRAAHATARAFERDRARDRALTAAGWRAIRITWRQLHRDRVQLAAELQRLLDGPHAEGSAVAR